MTPEEIVTLPLGLLVFGAVVLVNVLERFALLPITCPHQEKHRAD